MSSPASFFHSSIGRKVLMALTGVILIGFIVGHLIGNLQIFEHPDKINGYAAFLHQTGDLIWIVRVVLLASVIIHVWTGTSLALENREARGVGKLGYDTRKKWIRAAWASRYIRWTGYVVLVFILYHLAHFTFGVTNPADFKAAHPYVMQQDYAVAGFPVVKAGTEVPNVYLMVYRGFESVPVALFYIIAIGFLTVHLLHGANSLFQSFGWRSYRWATALRRIVGLCCLLYFLGNLAIPGAILSGVLRPDPAAQVHAPTPTNPTLKS